MIWLARLSQSDLGPSFVDLLRDAAKEGLTVADLLVLMGG